MRFRARRLALPAAIATVLTIVVSPSAGKATDPVSTPITVTSSVGVPDRGDTANAFDGNTGTDTYTTPSYNATLPSYLETTFASSEIGRIRIYKNTEYGPHDLTIQTINSADAVPTWTNVSGMVNGFFGAELLTATSVNTNGTVTGDAHDSASSGWASLTFDTVTATGLRIAFTTAHPNVHYHVYELEIHNVAEAAPPVVGVVKPNGGEVWARGVPHQIKWFSANPGSTTVRIVLLKAGTYRTRIANARPTSDGAFTWTPSNALAPGTNYKIRIVVNGTTINDVSNANFRLT
ncbi:MAG: Kre9/KNH-like N-terminal Ig-like domain [Actinomycetota bacterium]